MGPFPTSNGNKYILVAMDNESKWVEAHVLPTNNARVVVKFLKKQFSQFGTPREIIRDRAFTIVSYNLRKFSGNMVIHIEFPPLTIDKQVAKRR